jgi:methylmalonyl-CoA mutase N-terminal domain/subunit
MKFYVQAIGSTYTREQPYNNMVRGTLEALAAILGGCQALHVSCFDEVHQLPSEFGHLQSLRTQQILALESGVASVVDPLGGSYYVESLTDEIERKALAELDNVEGMGGLTRASEEGYFMQLANAGADRLYGGMETGDIPLVGSNCFKTDEDVHVPKTGIDPAGARDQVRRLEAIRRTRNNDEIDTRLRHLQDAVAAGTNVMGSIKELVRAQASVGQICDVVERQVGKFKDPAIVASA